MTPFDLPIATVVDWKALAEASLASLVAGSVLTFAFSLAIVGTTKAAEFRRANRRAAAVAAGALGAIALAASIGAVVVGLIVMID